MRNNFKIVSSSGETAAFNNVLNAFGYWTMRYAYASYISLSGEGHRLDKPATIVDFNDNVNKGELYATYSIDVTMPEFPYSIESIGFAPYPNAQLSNECKVRVRPQSMTVYGTIYLDVSDNDFSFYPDENHLIRSLLGMEAYETVTVKGGGDSTLNSAGIVNENEYEKMSSHDSLGRGLSINFESNDKTNFLLFCKDKPCILFNLGFFAPEKQSKTANSRGGFYSIDAVKVESLSENIPFETYSVVSDLYDSGADAQGGLSGYEFFGDPLYRYAGLKNGRDFYFIEDDVLRPVKGGTYLGNIMMCSDGEVVSVNEGEATFHRRGKKVSIANGQTVVLSSKGGYDIFVLEQDMLYIYRYDDGVSLVRSVSEVGGTLYRANDYSVVVASGSEKRVFTVDGEASYTYDLNLIGDEVISDGCYYGSGYMGSFLNYSRFLCDKARGRLCLSGGDLYYVGEGGSVMLKSNFEFDDAVIAGSKVMFLKDGSLSFYRAGFKGVFVSAPVFELIGYDALVKSTADRSVTLKINQKEV